LNDRKKEVNSLGNIGEWVKLPTEAKVVFAERAERKVLALKSLYSYQGFSYSEI
jgi:hypothetical protein